MASAEFYGDATRWFVGTVVDGSPPPGFEGSVQIRIHGIHSNDTNDIPQADLPWAMAVVPSTEPGVSGLGGACRLLPGAQVFGIFMDGHHSQTPLIIGSIAKTEYPTTVQAIGRDDVATNRFAYAIRQQQSEAVSPTPVTDNTNFNGNDLGEISTMFFIDNGYTVEQAAGISGTIFAVSQFNPTQTAMGGYGLMGWIQGSTRHNELKQFARSINVYGSWDNMDMQLLFILRELRTTQTAAQGRVLRSKVPYMADETLSGISATASMVRYYLPNRAQRTLGILSGAGKKAKSYMDEATK